jgi:hypothetical protein
LTAPRRARSAQLTAWRWLHAVCKTPVRLDAIRPAKGRLGVGSNIFCSLADAMSGPVRSRVPVTSTATAARRGAGDSGAGGGVAAAPVAPTAAALSSQDARASVLSAAPRAAVAEPPVKAAAHLVTQDELEALVQEARWASQHSLQSVFLPAHLHAHARRHSLT